LFEKFTDDARKVVAMSYSEASTVGHTEVDTTHLLLGMTYPGDGSVSEVLADAGVTGDTARARVLEIVGSSSTPTSGHLPFTENAKTALAVALFDSRARGDSNVRSENLLRAILAEETGTTAQVLSDAAGPNLAALKERIGAPAGGESAAE
jgi:ATP-dependent Clp protease ATP-binding subunit ClpA